MKSDTWHPVTTSAYSISQNDQLPNGKLKAPAALIVL